MGKVKINIQSVVSSAPQLRRIESDVSSTERQIASLISSVDNRIKSRSGITPSIQQISHSLKQVESKLKGLETFLQMATHSYRPIKFGITSLVCIHRDIL